MLWRMAKRMKKSFTEMRDEQHTRMRNVMADIRALNDSMVASAEHSTNSSEMQRLRFQVERYEQVIPVYQAQITDTQERNKKFWADLLGERSYIEQLKIRLDRAEALAISLGTPKPNKRSRTDEQEHKDDGSDHEPSSSDDEDEDGGEDEDEREQSNHSSSSSDDGQSGAGAQPGTDQNMETSPDLSAPRTDPGKTDKGKDTATTTRSSYREALEAPKEHHARDAIMSTSSGTDSVPAHNKLITLSSLGIKKNDSANMRTRNSAEQSSDQEQPVSKKPPQNSDPISLHLAGVALHPAMQKVLDHPSSEATQGMLQAGREIVAERRVRNQEKEELIQEEVRKSAQNVRWVKPVPSKIDHWFYDLR
jgi:hypothetical protein